MPIQTPQRTEYLSCPVCENAFEAKTRLPISLGCGHSICRTCLSNLQRKMCPFDQGPIRLELSQLPVNTALILLIDPEADLDEFRIKPTEQITNEDELEAFEASTRHLEELALFLRPSARQQQQQQLSRPMHRKLVTLINCQLLEEEGRARAARAARSLGERSVTELILQHQNPQQLSANLWAAVRARGCQFLGPAMQEEVLNLVLLALEDGSALSRKVLVMFVVQRLEPQFPQASKTSIGHVVQLLYRASCFKVTKRDGDSSLMQLKEEFRTYDTLRREHDAQIVQIATEAGLRIAPDQWSSLLYGDTTHKSHMQSIIDKLQTPQSFLQSVQELIIALQRTGDPGQLGALRPHLDFLATLDASPDSECPDWTTLTSSLQSVNEVVAGLLTFIEHHHRGGRSVGSSSAAGGTVTPASGGYLPHSQQTVQQAPPPPHPEVPSVAAAAAVVAGQQMQQTINSARYKTSLCRDFTNHGSCPRGRNCTFAHSTQEMESHRAQSRAAQQQQRGKFGPPQVVGGPALPPPGHQGMSLNRMMEENGAVGPVGSPFAHPHHLNTQYHQHNQLPPPLAKRELPPGAPNDVAGFVTPHMTPVAQVAPLQRAVAVVAAPSLVYHHNAGPPPPTQQQQQQMSEMFSAGAGEVDSLVMNPDVVVPPPVQGSTFVAHAQMGNTPNNVAPEHRSNEERYPPRNEDQISAMKTMTGGPPPVGMASKSLSALKSRKEEIIENLEDLIGKEETEKIAHNVTETVVHPQTQKQQQQQQQQQRPAYTNFDQSSGSNSNSSSVSVSEAEENLKLQVEASYSIWTSRSIATLASTQESKETLERTASAPECRTSDESLLDAEAASLSLTDEEVALYVSTAADDFIPFSETPHISRFGPISRKPGTMLQSASPRQAQAVISDEPTMTAVVRHSKQLARQVPTLAALYHQNGSRTTLQPVAVGVNGEIGYIAVPEAAPTLVAAAPTAPTDPTLQHIQQTSVQQQHEQQQEQQTQQVQQQQHSPSPTHQGLASSQSLPAQASQHGALFAESERMKQELELLQKKISDLKYSEASETSSAEPRTSVAQQEQYAKNELSHELRMIESSIKDREREININHMRVAAAESNEGLDYPTYGVGSAHYDQSSSTGIVTTATSGLCPKTRGRYALN